MTVEEILTEASLLVEQRPEGHAITETQFDHLIGDMEGPTGRGLVGRAAAREGYQATVDLRAGREAEVEPWVYVAKPGQTVPTLVKRSSVAEFLGLESSDWEKDTRAFAERVDRTSDPVIVYRQMEPVKPIKWYINGQGRYLPWDQAEKLGRNPEAIRQAGYENTDIEELSGWRQITDGTGQTWFVSPTDGLLYRKMPFRAGISGSFDISDAIDSNGKLRLEWVQGSQGIAMGVGGGVTLKQAQQLLMDGYGSGEILLDEMYRTDIATGATTWDNLGMDDLDSMLWSPADAANRSIRDVLLNHPDWSVDKRERRALQARQEQRRIARVREWFDERPENARPSGLREEMELNDPILRGQREAGVHMGTPRKPERAVEGPPRPKREFPTPTVRAPRPAQRPVMIDSLKLPQQAPQQNATRPLAPAPKPRYAAPPKPAKSQTNTVTRPRVF